MESEIELLFFHEGITLPSKDCDTYIKLLNKLSIDKSIKYSKQTKKQIKKSFQKRKAHTPTTYFLGYDTDKNGDIVIDEGFKNSISAAKQKNWLSNANRV